MSESHRRLCNDAKLDLSPNEQRGHDQRWDDLNQVVVPGREEAQVAVHRGDPAEVVGQSVDTPQQSSCQAAFASQKRHRFGVFADVDQVRAEVGLLVGLAVVKSDQRPAEVDRYQGADRGVPDGDTK